ncbi:MAG TPA: hypothetical protein VK850_08350 [Candidatus Binatia bacterium]|nr:hypothetical protein [Candidatus Binatia bacterium]
MPPNTIGPEFFDPLAAEGTLMPPLEAPGAVDTSQGSPAGLGVTITGGSTNPPAVPITPPPTNATGGDVTNPPLQ